MSPNRLSLGLFTMRNKLKRSTNKRETPSRSKNQTQTTEVITLVSSASSCSDEETTAKEDLTAKENYGSAAERKVQPVQEEKKKTFSKDIKIAPIFIRKSRGSRGSELQKQAAAPHNDDLKRVENQQQLSGSAASQPINEDRFTLPAGRRQLSPSSLDRYLQEIQTSNPTFAVQTVFSTLQKKASETLQDLGSTENLLKEKRKRGDEWSERTSKRQRCGLSAEHDAGVDQCHPSGQDVQESIVLPVKQRPRISKLSRSHRLRQQNGSPANNCETNSGLRNNSQSDGLSVKTCDNVRTESCFEDVLWTDKYSPRHSSEVVGNCESVNKLHSWLKKWKQRADNDERRKMEEMNDGDNSRDLWDCGDFQGEAGAEDDRQDPLFNTVLITGPPGVGKTASVYACAQELGFKVFEVNCSSQRCGRHVLSQLKEATQSHLVETSGKDPLKPAYLNNYNTSSCASKAEMLPGKTVPAKNVISTTKKRPVQNFGCSGRKGKAKAATVTLANYFKMKAKADQFHFHGPSPSEKPDGKKLGNPSPGCDQTVPQSKKTTTSLILFEEVDVIFDDDVGFLTAIKTFMTTTKRPVILTTNDPLFRERFNCSVEEIIFKSPPAVNACSYLRLVCLVENVRLELDDVSSLLRLTCGDVRRCLLQLQLWVHSGGGRASHSGEVSKVPTHIQYTCAAERGDDLNPSPPPCDTGCTAGMLGLHSVSKDLLFHLLKRQHWSDKDMKKLSRFTTESWRGGVPLFYNNLEVLLNGAKGMSVHNIDKVTFFGLQSELVPSDPDPHFQQPNQNISLKVSATDRPTSVRRISRLSRRKHVTTVSDTTLSSRLTQKSQKMSPSSLKKTRSSLPNSSALTEQLSSKVTTDCLNALTDFFDLMSYLDVTLPAAAAPLVSGPCKPEAFVWTGAELKDGLLDEMSEEEENVSWNQGRLLEIQAAAESLGYHRCWWQVSEVWTKARKYRQEMGDKEWERLMFPASLKRRSLRFCFQPPCSSSVAQKRYELNRTLLSSKSLSLLGNRQAVSVDYAPVLRSICRFHKNQHQREEPARCVNYLNRIDLGLSQSTIQILGEDFS